jgi:carbamoyl-phosphate synthase large subunit
VTGSATAAVLITGMGSTTSISVVKALRLERNPALSIVGCDTNSAREIAGSTLCDAFEQVPPAADGAYIPALRDICARHRVRVLFPVIDAELEPVARAAGQFAAQGVFVWVSAADAVAACNDKRRTPRLLRDAGVPAVHSWLPEEARALGRDQFPVIVKPATGVSSRDVWRVDSPAELSAALERVPGAVVQAYLDPPEFTIDVVSDAAGKVLAAVPRERLETKAGISTKGRTVADPALIRIGAGAAAALNIRGACNVQCRMGRSGPEVFEVNPRFSGGLPLTVAAGVNGPAVLVRLALGLGAPVEALRFREGVYMARYWEERFFPPQAHAARAERADEQ